MMENDHLSELKKAALPIMQYLREHCDPHQSVVVTWDQIKIVTDEMGAPIRD